MNYIKTKRPVYPLCGECFGESECTSAIPIDESCPCYECRNTEADLLVTAPNHPLLGEPIEVVGNVYEAFAKMVTFDGLTEVIPKILDEIERITGLSESGIDFESTPAGLRIISRIPEGNIVSTLKASNQYHGE